MASTSRSELTVGFIGLGAMGGAMVRRIVDAGWPTVLWARRPEALDAFDGPNVETAPSPAALAAASDVVGICVWADDDVREVVAGVLDGAHAGTVVAIHSTVRPATCRELAAVAAERGVVVIDAPVTGGPNVALAGSLAVAAGGDATALARCRPVFDAFATTVIRLGDVGTGQVAKLLNNTLFAANLAVADAALALGEALGVDAAELEQFVQSGSGRSYGLEIAQRCRQSPETRAAARPALEKDVQSLAAEGAAHPGVGDVLHAAAAEAIRRLQG